MEKNKKILYSIIFVLIICLAIIGFKQLENKEVDTNINNEEQVDNKEQAEAEITTIPFDKDITLEEAESNIYEKYSNNNLRIVGAVIQEVNSDYIIVKTYRAGEGTTSIVEEKKINITNDTPVFETVMSPEKLDDEPITTRKTIVSLKAGDHIVIECADDKKMRDANEFTALIITKDVLIFDEPVEDKEVE